jgi:hypothetical protein
VFKKIDSVEKDILGYRKESRKLRLYDRVADLSVNLLTTLTSL